MSNTSSTQDDRATAFRMMRKCGLDGVETLLAEAEANGGSPTTVIAGCKWYLGEKTSSRNVSKGLLAWKIKQGGVEEVVKDSVDRRRRFEMQKEKFPIGVSPESHRALQDHKWPNDERCDGRMVVFGHWYPMMATECDVCGFGANYLLAKP